MMRGAKDVLSVECQPGVVHALGCAECPMVYVGETIRTVQQRVK